MFVSVQVAGVLVVSVLPDAPVTLAVALISQVPGVELAVTSVEAPPEELVVTLGEEGVPDAPEDGGVKVTVAPTAAMVVPDADVQVTVAWRGLANVVETGVD